jgi:hypothetical protein
MITKSRNASNPIIRVEDIFDKWDQQWYRTNTNRFTQSVSERIEYADGPKYVDFHSNWKRCSHIKTNVLGGTAATMQVLDTRTGYRNATEQFSPINDKKVLIPEQISGVNNHVTNTAVALLQDKFDLNCQDRVMGYSYALDLIPWLGPFLKASSVLNRIGKWAAKRGRAYRKRPFTMVVTDAMRADLINRFVIQTTIADTRQILTVYERCQRAWEQAHMRNQGWTTLTAQATTSKITETGTTGYKPVWSNYSWPFLEWGFNREVGVTSKVYAVLRLEYDIAKADPVRWIAQALGITTPLESVWDKIPFSFVCDYFFRVGDLIERVSHLDSSQDGLYGKVCDIAQVWATSRAFDQYITIENSGKLRPYPTYMAVERLKFGVCRYQSSLFYRNSIDMSDSSGFWDKGGFWNPRLSSTRKRTLLEMALLRAM